MITIKDVAREAEVSVSTVSKIINNTKRFSSAVELRVKSAVEKLEFKPNPHARSVSTGKTHAIGVVILDIANPYYAAVVKGISREADAKNHTVILADAEERPNRERDLIQTLSPRVDGLILAGSRLSDVDICALAMQKPIVTIGRVPGGEVMSVVSDEFEITFQLTRHLITTGRKRIAFLAGPNFWVNQQRLAGYEAALLEASLPSMIYQLVSPSIEGGESLAGTLLMGANRPDGILAYNDLAAMGLMKVARDLSVRIPEDVAVVGIGDIPFAALVSPPLTTAAVPSLEIGRLAATLLMQKLEGLEILEPALVLRAKLCIRASTRIEEKQREI